MQLTLDRISKTFGPLKANDNITYTFEEGQVYAVLGENGAGKSTLMKIIAGYQPPDSGGRILIDDQPITIPDPSQAIEYGIGMLYQDPLDFPPMTILENFATARPNSGFFPNYQFAREQLNKISQRFGFTFDPDALIETLSIGERQQLEIVRLLSLGVRFLILDEPTTGISEEQRQQLFSTLRALAKDDRLTIAIVTHKLEDVEALCDGGFALRHGKVTGTFTMPTPIDDLVTMMFGEAHEIPSREDVPLGDPVLEVKDLTVYTKLLTIPNVSVNVREGEVLGLAGLDGSGQESFMRTCAGLNEVSWQDYIMSGVAFGFLLVIFSYVLGYSATVFSITMIILFSVILAPVIARGVQILQTGSPKVYFNNQPTRWKNYRDLRQKGLAYLSAGRLEEGLVSGLTLTQHFALVARSLPLWVDWLKARQHTQSAIATYDIRGQASSPIQTLSGGNQQRVALALLPQNLRLAFLENPTRGLDVNSAENIWNLLLERRKDGMAIVFSSPDLDEIVQYSDRVMVFSSGRWMMVDDKNDMNTTKLGRLIGGKQA